MGKTARNRARKKARRASLNWVARYHGKYVWLSAALEFEGTQTNAPARLGLPYEKEKRLWLVRAVVLNGYGLLQIVGRRGRAIAPEDYWRISYSDKNIIKLVSNDEVILRRLNGTLPAQKFYPHDGILTGPILFWERRELNS